MEKTLENQRTTSQLKQIREWLETGKSINPMQALDRFGCFRLGARIWDLRDKGMDIRTTLVDNGKGSRYAEYRLNRA